MAGRLENEITSFLAMLPIAAFAKDKEGKIVYLNAAAEKLWKVKANDVIGKALWEVLDLSERQVKANDLKVLQQNAAQVSVHRAAPARSPLRSFLEFPIIDFEGHRLLAAIMVQWDG